ncbi:MAG TPA: GAF domain-containing protein [Rhodocyclaceae bacterium]|nr:GAF domain-containing protein [Rhodocyclaceae bacterium]
MKSWSGSLERRSLNLKLMLGFSLMLLGLVTVGVAGLLVQRAMVANLQVLYTEDMRGVLLGKDVQVTYTTIGRTVREAVLAPDSSDRERALEQIAIARSKLAKSIESLRPTLFRGTNTEKLSRFEEELVRYLRGVDTAISLMQNGKDAEAAAFVTTDTFRQPGFAANEILEELVNSKIDGAHEQFAAAIAAAERSSTYLAILVTIICLTGLLLWVLFSRSVHGPLDRLRRAVEQLASGQLDHAVPLLDYNNEIGALARAVAVLQTEAQQMEAQRWIKTHVAAVSAALQAASSLTDLSNQFLSGLAPLLRIGHAAFYLYKEDERRLSLLGGYALRDSERREQSFAPGEGLIGQCALERKPIVLEQAPADYIRIGSGLGNADPHAISVLPVLHNDRLLAVLELASFESFESFGSKEQALLDGLMPILAMNIEILERNAKTRLLLEETQRQAEHMKQQAAALEEQTIELEAQQHSLKASAEELARLEARSRLILGSVNGGIVGLDRDCAIGFANPAAPTIIAKPLSVSDMSNTMAQSIRGATAPDAGAAQRPDAGGEMPDLPHLPGVDIKAGMAISMNRQSLYTRLLCTFRDSQGKFAELFVASQTGPDPLAATRAAHTLRGAAGNIGARRVQAAAGELEDACNAQAPSDRIAELLEKTLAELAPVIDGLQGIGAVAKRPEVAEAPAAPAIVLAEHIAALKNLQGLLENSDAEAGDRLDALLASLGTSPLGRALRPVSAAIAAFDFDAALEKLKGVAIE